MYIESLHIPGVDCFLKRLGFQASEPPTRRGDEDPVLFKIRCKVVAHVGFLVEACVEAIPQSVLQLVAMQHAGEVSFFSVLSIILSISCLASKGYIASFSVHFRTFVFNALCIAADVLNLFVCASWLSSPMTVAPAAQTMCSWWFKLAIFSAICFGSGGLGVVFREKVNCEYEEWSKIFRLQRWDWSMRNVVKDTLGGSAVITLGFFPALVMMLSVKLSLIPTVALQSLDTHTNRTRFRELFDWVMSNDVYLRLFCAINVQMELMKRSNSEFLPMHIDEFKEVLLAWEPCDARERMLEGSCTVDQLRHLAANQTKQVLRIHQEWMWARVKQGLHSAWREFKRYCKHGGSGYGRAVTCGEVWAGVFFALGGVGFSLFVLWSAMLPVVCLGAQLMHSTQGHTLELVLSGLYASLLCLLCYLAPSVILFTRFSEFTETISCAITYNRILPSHKHLGRHSQTVSLMQRSYNGWIVGCQVQAGLLEKFGLGIPDLIHGAGKQSLKQGPDEDFLHDLVSSDDQLYMGEDFLD